MTAQAPRRLRLLTLNTWLLRASGWRVARDLAARAERLPNEVLQTGADLVTLQEVWPADVAAALAERFRALGYLYAVRGTPRAGPRLLGDGLMIVSRYPLAETGRLTFTRRSVWFESFIAKGALAAEVALPWGEALCVATAHLGVVRFDFRRGAFRDDDARTRREQLDELADWLEGSASPPARHLVLAGDLNVIDRPFENGRYQPRPAPDYEGFMERLRFKDAYRERHAEEAGFTFDPATNGYAARGRCRLMPGERIDYVLYRRDTGLRADAVSLAFRDPPWLSDHYGVLADLRFETTVWPSENSGPRPRAR